MVMTWVGGVDMPPLPALRAILASEGRGAFIDTVDGETGGATGRSKADAPEIDGEVHLRDAGGLNPGDVVSARIEDSDEHDLFGVPLETVPA